MATAFAQRLKPGQVARALDEYSPVKGWVTIEHVDHRWSGSTLLTADGRDYRVNMHDRFEVLTPAQQRYLDEIRAAGKKSYNGRARKTIKALEATGLVTVDWDMEAHAKGSGIELVEHITVTPKEA